MLFEGRNQVVYPYARYGWTRGNGGVWHGGMDVVGVDSPLVRMPYYKGTPIHGRVTRARIVTDHKNLTWEWGYYVCVQLDADQTPDRVNFLYFCHMEKLLVTVGCVVKSGDVLGVMGNSGNAALAVPPYKHLHFEVRATAGGYGLDPTAYTEFPNAVGVYGVAKEPVYRFVVEPVSTGDAAEVAALCERLGLVYTKSEVGE